MEAKRHWLGQRWCLPRAAVNHTNKASQLFHRARSIYCRFRYFARRTSPNILLAFRHQTLLRELNMIKEGETSAVPSPFATGYNPWTTDAEAHTNAAEAMLEDNV